MFKRKWQVRSTVPGWPITSNVVLEHTFHGTDAGSRSSDNMVDLVFLNFIHTTPIYTTLNIFNAFK